MQNMFSVFVTCSAERIFFIFIRLLFSPPAQSSRQEN